MKKQFTGLIIVLVFMFAVFSSAYTIETTVSMAAPTELLTVAAPEDNNADATIDDTSNEDEEEEEPDPPAADITLNFNNPPDSMKIGDKVKIAYELDNAPKNTKLEWSSSNEDVATVDSKGTVKAISPGKVEITASVPNSGVKTSTLIDISEIDAKSIKITAQELSATDMILNKHTITVGDKVHLNYEVDPKDAAVKDAKWTCSDESVLIVDGDGVLTAIAEGEATVTLKAGDLKDEITFEVEEKEGVNVNLLLIISGILFLIAIIVIIALVAKRNKNKKAAKLAEEQRRRKLAQQKQAQQRQAQQMQAQQMQAQQMQNTITPQDDERTRVYQDFAPESSVDRSTMVYTPEFGKQINEGADIDDIIDIDEETDYLEKNDNVKKTASGKDEPFSIDDIE